MALLGRMWRIGSIEVSVGTEEACLLACLLVDLLRRLDVLLACLRVACPDSRMDPIEEVCRSRYWAGLVRRGCMIPEAKDELHDI
jgi:hypothetical protein